jgi:hypothetical protein
MAIRKLRGTVSIAAEGMWNRNRYAVLGITVTLLTVLLGCGTDAPIAKTPSNETVVQSFFALKEQQARRLALQGRKKIPPEVWPYFAAARDGDWQRVTCLYFQMARRCYQFENQREPDARLSTPVWQPVNETYRFYEQCSAADPKHLLAFGREVIASIPAGSIYFGGSDPGRFVITALCRDQPAGDPFFVLTQNALADGVYLKYLRSMFAGKIQIPTDEDSQHAYVDYMEDAQRRLREKRLKPGEDVRYVDNRVQVSGPVAIMEINALLARAFFAKNPDRDVFIEMGHPIDWMYPHLTPHGLILRINRKPLSELGADVIAKDHEFWKQRVVPLIGEWLSETTSVLEICSFAEAVYLRHDLQKFKADPQFIEGVRALPYQPAYAGPNVAFGRARASIAGLYVWRSAATKDLAQSERLAREADFAFRQAIALCPHLQEAVYGFVNLLLTQERFDDALLVAVTAQKFSPQPFGDLEKQIRSRMK